MLDRQRRDLQPCERVTGIRDAHIAGIDRKPDDPCRSPPPARGAAVVCRNIENTPAEPVHA